MLVSSIITFIIISFVTSLIFALKYILNVGEPITYEIGGINVQTWIIVNFIDFANGTLVSVMRALARFESSPNKTELTNSVAWKLLLVKWISAVYIPIYLSGSS